MNSPLKIYSGSTLIYTTPINTGCQRKVQLMTEDSITVKFSDRQRFHFPIGSRIEDFYITESQNITYNTATGAYDYTLKFNAYYWLWANRILYYVMPGVADAPKETSFNVTATIDVHAAIIIRALADIGFAYNGSPIGVSVDEDFSSEAKNISYADMSVLGGIQAIADAYECEWWVTGNTIHFGKCHDDVSLDTASQKLNFTIDDNVESITVSNSSKQANRLIVFGSDRNLPPNYREVSDSDITDAVVQRRLMLPDGIPYVQTDDNIPDDEIVEEEVTFDYIYPRTSLTVSKVSPYTAENDGKTQTFYRIEFGSDFIFSQDYILPDEELHLVFESGLLLGMDFAVKFNPKGLAEKNDDGSWNPDAQMLEIVVNEDYGRELPDDVLCPMEGDTFSLYGWDATKMEDLGLVAKAEKELLAEAEKEIEERKKDLDTYTCKMMWNWCKEKSDAKDMPKLGSTVILHFEKGDAGRTSRIIGYEHDLDIEYSNVTYTCGEKVSSSRLKTLESKVEGLTHTGEKTKIQNSLDFLSKRYSDRTPYKIASDLGFEIGNYLSGVSGGMFGMDKTDGQSFAEVYRLFVRGKAYFETLTIIEAETIGGRLYITPGGSVKLTRVVEGTYPNGTKVYRCYFLSEQDGEKSETKIVAGDMVISEMFNVRSGTMEQVGNRRYWRRVSKVTNEADDYTDPNGNIYGYIDLLDEYCEPGSDIPQAGDIICQLGNKSEKSRQAAMILDTVGADAPSIKMLTGIDSYSLEDKDIISQGYDHASAEAYFRVGSITSSQFFDYRQKSGLKLAGTLSASSKITDGSNLWSLDEWLKSYGYTDDTAANEAKGEIENYKYLREALQNAQEQSTTVSGGLVLTTLVSLGYVDSDNVRHTMAGMNGSWVSSLEGRSIGSWWGGDMLDRFDANDNRLNVAGKRYATSLMRMDGSAYFADGKVGFKKDGGGWLAGDNITWDENGAMTFGNGIKIDLGGEESTTLGNLQSSVSSVMNAITSLTKFLTPVGLDENGNQVEIPWKEASLTDNANGGYRAKSIKAKLGFWSTEYISARGQDTTSGGGGIFGLYTDSTWASDALATDALSASLGKTLYNRILSLENKNYLDSLNILPSGSGNAVTALELSSDKKNLTYVKGTTFVTTGSVQEISGSKTFLSGLTVKNTATSGASARHLVFTDSDNANHCAFGSYIEDGVFNRAYIGWGDYPWRMTSCLSVSEDRIAYKDNSLLHTANYASILDSRYLQKTVYTASDVLAKIKTVDGSGSGLDADLLDGVNNGYLTARYINTSASPSWDCDDPQESMYADYGTSDRTITNMPDGWSYGSLLTIGRLKSFSTALSMQLMWDVEHGKDAPGIMWFRTKDSTSGWRSWGRFLHESGGKVDVSASLINVSRINAPSGQPLHLCASGNNDLTISSNGYVGIGVGVTPYRLEVVGTAKVTVLKIGNRSIDYDTATGALHVDGGFYTDGFLSCRGADS